MQQEARRLDPQQVVATAPTDPDAFLLWASQRPAELPGRDGAIALGGLAAELAMAAIFRGIPDHPTP
jgi:hypothetical protein